jgi:hypothetical protein
VQDLPGHYQETLWAPISWWCMGAAGVVAVWWCFVVATPALVAAVAALGAAVLVVGGLLGYSRVRLSTDTEGLHAGRAMLPWAHVGAVEVLDAEGTRRLLGVDADARAHLLLRTYCRGAVKVTVDDARDPTPYWVVSTRHPADLAAHLRGGIDPGPGGAARRAQHT